VIEKVGGEPRIDKKEKKYEIGRGLTSNKRGMRENRGTGAWKKLVLEPSGII